jgi:hypothetical protein
MNFDPSKLLRKATSRAKSDVANKLVSMLLHELSRRVNQTTRLTVNGPAYSRLAADFFGSKCPYCSRELVARHVSVEHLDGMNRFRAGLHIPGNVVVSCSDCNREKRRDDQLRELSLAKSGWESFLSHDSLHCKQSCKTCAYWEILFPDIEARKAHLFRVRSLICEFRNTPEVAASIEASLAVQETARHTLENFYRESQAYALTSIKELVDSIWK